MTDSTARGTFMLRLRSARPSDAGAHPSAHERRHERSRGQGLVEFALVIPIILLLTLTALDFGRVYLGYINLQNMARIAANFAANNPHAWGFTPDPEVQTKYRNQIIADAEASNCALPVVDGQTVVPTPVFTDLGLDGTGTDVGDLAKVQISCTFGVITPGIANIVGHSLTVSAASSFPVKSGMVAIGAIGGPGGSPPNAAFMANGVVNPTPISGTATFDVEFRDTSGGNPSSWSWVFPGGTPSTSTAQDPGIVKFSGLGVHTVQLTVENVLGSSGPVYMDVTVTSASSVDFIAAPNPPSVTQGGTVTFADNGSTPGGTSYAWTFGAGEGGVTHPDNRSVTHQYNAAGDYTVTLTVTYPAPDGAITATKTGYVHVGGALCTVPFLNGIHRNSAPGAWSFAGFTGAVTDAPGAPSGNYIITAQSLAGSQKVLCTSGIVVNRP